MKRTDWLRLAVLVLVLCWLPLGSAQPVAVGNGCQPLRGHLEAWFDDAGTAGIDQVEQAHSLDFRPLASNAVFGFRRHGALWLRFRLDWGSGATGERWLEVTPMILGYLALYRPDHPLLGGPQVSGQRVPYSSRSLSQRGLLLQVPPVSGVETLYLRVQSSSTLLVEPRLWSPSLYQAHARREDSALAFAAGVILILAGLHFFSGLLLTGRPSLLYAGFLLVMLVNFLAWYGMFGALLVPEAPWVDRWGIVFSFPCIVAIAWPLFAAMVRLPPSWARWDRWIQWLGWMVAGAGALGYLLGQPALASSILSSGLVLLLVMLFLAGGWLAYKGNPVAQLYLLAFVPVILPALLSLAQTLGLLDAVHDIQELHRWAMLSHLVLMSLPMGGHWLRLRRERDEAQGMALQAAQEAEQHLERLVTQRTAELWEAKDQAEAALKATMTVVDGQRQFLRTVNHEFRTPLAVLDGHLQLLGQEIDATKSERLPRMRAKIRDLQQLLETALNQDRLETGVWGREFERVDPAALVRDAIARLDANPDTHPIQFHGTDLPATILANPTMLSILLSNLLENAVRYSPDGGLIQVFGQRREGPWFRIQVTDHGVGMTPNQMERAFEPFYRTGQVDGAIGSGLGLHLAREIARHHGGDLTVESQPGSGSTFSVLLPCRPWSGLEARTL